MFNSCDGFLDFAFRRVFWLKKVFLGWRFNFKLLHLIDSVVSEWASLEQPALLVLVVAFVDLKMALVSLMLVVDSLQPAERECASVLTEH